jgi:hypothetical protein
VIDMETNYEVLGDILSALNHLDQAQSEFPRNSEVWLALGKIYQSLLSVSIAPAECEFCCNPVTAHAYECIGEEAWTGRKPEVSQLASDLLALEEHNGDIISALLSLRAGRVGGER